MCRVSLHLMNHKSEIGLKQVRPTFAAELRFQESNLTSTRNNHTVYIQLNVLVLALHF